MFQGQSLLLQQLFLITQYLSKIILTADIKCVICKVFMVTTIFLMVFFQIFYGMLHKHMALFDDVLSNGLAQKSLELIMHVKSFAKKHILTCVLALSKI